MVTVASSAELPGCGDPSVATVISFTLELNGQEYSPSTAVWDSSRVQPLSFYRLHLPMLFVSGPTAPTDRLPDLEVIDITALPGELIAGQPAEVQVTIRNNSDIDITRSFWVDLYLGPERAPQAGEGWPALSEFGASWRVYGLRAGATLVLSTLTPNDPLNPDQSYSNFSGFGLAGEASLYAQVDAYGLGGTAAGAIGEADEANTIVGKGRGGRAGTAALTKVVYNRCRSYALITRAGLPGATLPLYAERRRPTFVFRHLLFS